MSEQSVPSSKTLEVDFSDDDRTDLARVDFHLLERVIVHIPLPSFGVSNSHIDLCGDLLDASWALEKLAIGAERIETTVGDGYFKPNITATLHHPLHCLRDALVDCALVFMEDDANPAEMERLQDLRSQIADYEEMLPTITPRVPDIVDWYFTNLMAANGEFRSEAPDFYAEQMQAFPERRVGYFRSAYSVTLAGPCYASNEGWVIDAGIDVDRFLISLGQAYRLGEFRRGEIVSLPGGTFVHSDGQLVGFPAKRYFRSQVCAHLALGHDDDNYVSELTTDSCFVHETGTLLFVNDGRFRHFLFDTKPLSLVAAKAVREAAASMLQKLSLAAGIPEQLSFEWASLSDEQFEQLCYDIIYANPKFDSDTIRKLGKSRSRDGGRDIEVLETRRWQGGNPRKWIFQCKLVTNGSSLGATKLVDVGDMLDHTKAQGFGVMTSVLIDATLYDKIDSVCGKRDVEQYHFSVLELERAVARHPGIRKRYFP